MFNKYIKLSLCLLLFSTVISCGTSDELLEEERLRNNFSNESPELQKHVALIIDISRQKKYQEAMNELAIMSATRTLTAKQKNAIENLIKRLRFDMEEELTNIREAKGMSDE